MSLLQNSYVLISMTKLSFSRHVSYIKNKISKGIGIIIKARKYLNRKSLLDLYHAFVYPYLTYCIEVWGNMSNVHIDLSYRCPSYKKI